MTPSTCNFCDVENLENPNLLLKDVLSSGQHQHQQHHHEAIHKLDECGIAGSSMTCRAVAELAPIVTNDNFCQDLQSFRPICCPDFETTCTMCGSSSSGTLLTRPDAVIPGRSACNAQRNGCHTDMNLVARAFVDVEKMVIALCAIRTSSTSSCELLRNRTS